MQGKVASSAHKLTHYDILSQKTILYIYHNNVRISVHTAAIYSCMLTSYWSLPTFSFSATSSLLSDKVQYSTLIRLMSPFDNMALALKNFLNYFSVGINSV